MSSNSHSNSSPLPSILAPPTTPPVKCPSCPILQCEVASANERTAQACQATREFAEMEMEALEEEMQQKMKAMKKENKEEIAFMNKRHKDKVQELENALDEADATYQASDRMVKKQYGRLLAYDDEMRQKVDEIEWWKKRDDMWRAKVGRRDNSLEKANARIQELEDQLEAARLQSAVERLGFQEGLAAVLPELGRE